MFSATAYSLVTRDFCLECSAQCKCRICHRNCDSSCDFFPSFTTTIVLPFLLFFRLTIFHGCFSFAVFSSAWLCQQSYCRGVGVRRPSVVRKLRSLGVRCIDPGHILWVAPSPPYLQVILCLFVFLAKISIFKFLRFCFSFSFIWDPMGANISKRYASSFHPICAKVYEK